MSILTFEDHSSALTIVQELVDRISFRIVMSIIDDAKNVTQIAEESQIPLSSTYKKIRKLQEMGIVFVEKIDIDDNGKKVLFYRSKIKALEFNMTRDKVILQFEKNEHPAKN